MNNFILIQKKVHACEVINQAHSNAVAVHTRNFATLCLTLNVPRNYSYCPIAHKRLMHFLRFFLNNCRH
jgi:hypothetical protein